MEVAPLQVMGRVLVAEDRGKNPDYPFPIPGSTAPENLARGLRTSEVAGFR
jgi:hypothetical protein